MSFCTRMTVVAMQMTHTIFVHTQVAFLLLRHRTFFNPYLRFLNRTLRLQHAPWPWAQERWMNELPPKWNLLPSMFARTKPHEKAFISTPAMCGDTFVASLTDQNISQVFKTCWVRRRTNQRLGGKYLSFSPCEGCGSSLPPRRALVYFQWCCFQASNHIIKALHHIYSSTKVPDSLQLFPTPTAKP